MKKRLALLLALLLILCACGGVQQTVDTSQLETRNETEPSPVSSVAQVSDTPAAPEVSVPAETPPETQTEEPGPDLDPVSGDVGGCHVSILSAEQFEDAYGNPALRVYYDFTNNTGDVTSVWGALSLEARQAGYELVTTFTLNDVPEYGNDILSVIPGVTIRCVAEYAFQPEGGLVTFTVRDFLGGDALTMQFDPDALQGRPAGEFAIAPIADPTYVSGMASEGVYDGDYYVKITGYEIVSGWDGDVIRVFFEFTNNSQEPTSFFLSTFVVALQDGVSLNYGYAGTEIPEDGNDAVNVAPGETITATEIFELRSDSPIEVFLDEFFEADTIGLMCPVA